MEHRNGRICILHPPLVEGVVQVWKWNLGLNG